MRRTVSLAAGAMAVLACGRGVPAPAPTPAAPPPPRSVSAASDAAPLRRTPLLPPQVAFTAGLMPLESTGVPAYRTLRPTADGRGVLIAILDTGLDPGTGGLITTTAGGAKVLDVRDFSGEGHVPLAPVAPDDAGGVEIAGRRLTGAGRVARLAVGSAWYGGVFRELPLGPPPASDVNGNGTSTDAFPLVVVRASDGWVTFLDTNLNGSFEDEMPLHDFRQGQETLSLGTRPLTLAANFSEAGGVPRLALQFDTDGHGTAVAGVAAGHNLFGVSGFHGVAPGASLLGLKISNNARGGVSVTGSLMAAMAHAVRFAAQRNLPLVINLSWGVGNEREGQATIDSLLDAFVERHPDVVVVVAAGNDGPGLSTVGFPATADRVLAVGSTLPGAFASPGSRPSAERAGFWSARGGEVAKPDLVAPGMAFSTVPPWDVGNEIHVGTSLSTPHVAGLVANLLSAMVQDGRRPDAGLVVQALRATAMPLADASALDQGAGLPRLDAAYRWLAAGHQASGYEVRAQTGFSAAFRRSGLASRGDTLEVFTVRHVSGHRAGRFELRASAPWLRVPDAVDAAPGVTEIAVRYRRDLLGRPGLHVGTVTARNPRDTLAGPLFTLVNTVVVPHDLTAAPMSDARRAIRPGRVERVYFVVPRSGTSFQARVTLPDSATQQAAVALFEPDGRPFRDVPTGFELGAEQGTAHFVVRAEDVVAGVYELTVAPAPLGPPAAATVALRVELAPLALAAENEAVVLGNHHAAPISARVTPRRIGAERRVRLDGRGAVAESLTVSVPAWATRGGIEVRVRPEVWSALTDLGVTLFDSSGSQVAREPQHYALGRQALAVDSTLAGRDLTLELFPGWADSAAVRIWEAAVRVWFVADTALRVGETVSVDVPANGRVRVATVMPEGPGAPPGFAPLLEVTADAGSGAPAVTRFVQPGDGP